MGVNSNRPGGTSGYLTPTGVESVQNKDIDGGTASNTSRVTVPKAARATLDALTRKEGTVVYDTTSDKLLVDNGTQLTELGSGSGELNLIENPSDAVNWSETGTVFATPVTTTTAGDLPLGGLTDTAIQLVASGNGTEATDYNSYSFTTPASLSGKMKVEFYQRPGSGFAESEWTVSVYESTTRQSLSTDSSGVTYLVNANNKRTVYVDLLASTAYTLRFARVAGSGSATLNISNVIVGPGIQAQSAALGDTLSWTPTGSWSTNTTYTGKYTRFGRWALMEVKAALSGAPTATALTINMPSGMTIDTDAMVAFAATDDQSFGQGTAVDSGTANYPIRIGYQTTTVLRVFAATATGSYTAGAAVSESIPITFGASDSVNLRFWVPIAEWAGSGTVNLAQNDVEYAYNTSTSTSASDTTSFGYGPQGAVIQQLTATLRRRVRFQTPIQNSDTFQIEVSADRTYWLPLPNAAVIIEHFTYNGATNQAGIGYDAVPNNTDLDIWFGKYANRDSAWNSSNGAYYWRVRKLKGGAAVAFGLVTSTSSGLVPASGSLGYIRLGTQNGQGSTNNCIRRFSTVITNTSTDVTYADSATLGASFTINRSGLYSISYTDSASAAANFGVSLNSSQLTTNIAGITQADRLFLFSPTGNDLFQTGSITIFLNSGDVIRAHNDNSSPSSTTARTQFTIQRIY